MKGLEICMNWLNKVKLYMDSKNGHEQKKNKKEAFCKA